MVLQKYKNGTTLQNRAFIGSKEDPLLLTSFPLGMTLKK
jgi:hypothetical protein